VPIQPCSKRPGLYRNGRWRDYPQWTRHCKRDTTAHEIDIWGNWPRAGIGVAAGRFIGIDIDVLEPEALAASIEGLAKRCLGETPAVRIGRAPKRLLVYRATEPFAGFKYPPIEVLGMGQLFIAYGIHPDTAAPYAWPVATLRDLDPQELPAISEAQARAFATTAYALIDPAQRPQTLVAGLSPHKAASAARDDTAQGRAPALRGTLEAVRDALPWITNHDLDYDSWVRVGLAIKGAVGEEGWPLFEAWSALSAKYDAAFTRGRWQSFAPQRIGAGTLYRLALERGWQPPAAIRLNGACGMPAPQAGQTLAPHPARGLLEAVAKRSAATVQTAASIAPGAATPAQAAASAGAALWVDPPPADARAPVPMPAGWSHVGGVLQALMDFMAATAKRPQPVLALGASLCAVGALMGRRYRTASNVRSNLYIVGIAESGAGKNHSRVVISDLFQRAGLLQYLGGNKIASGAGLLSALQRQPAILFQLDEFGLLLGAAADRRRSPRYLTEILDLMTELYTTAGSTYFGTEYALNPKAPTLRPIHQPCACVYGTATPAQFWQALQASNVADGSLARFLILESEEDFPASNLHFGLTEPPQSLLDALQRIQGAGGAMLGNLADVATSPEVCPEPRLVPMSTPAADALRALDAALLVELRASRGSGYSSILARIEEHATKLALIRAVSRDAIAPRIEEADATWAIALARHCAARTIREAQAHIAENAAESHHKRALQILRAAAPHGMSRSEFTRRTQFMDHKQRDGVLQTLQEAFFIEVSLSSSVGRPTTWLKLVENP